MPADTDCEVGDPPTAAGQEGVGWTTNELEELQQKDPNIGPLFAWFRSGNRPSREKVSTADSELKCYWTQWDSLELIDGLVCRKFERPDGSNRYSQLLIPRATRHRFLEMVHSGETGHFIIIIIMWLVQSWTLPFVRACSMPVNSALGGRRMLAQC